MMVPKPKSEVGKEAVFIKLGKSLVAKYNLKEGEKLTLDNLSGKIFDDQIIPVRESNKVLGKTLNRSVKQGESIQYEDLI